MTVLETLIESLHIGFVQLIAILMSHEEIVVVVNLLRSDREGYQHTDIMSHREIAQSLDLLRVQRTDDKVAIGRIRILQHLTDVGILGYVPSLDISRDAHCLQTVTSHQHTTIVFHHALAITIIVMQGKHNANTDCTLTHIGFLTGSNRIGLSWYLNLLWGSGRGRLLLRIRRERNLDEVATFQLIARRIHFGIGLDQFLNGKTILTGYAKNSLLTFHLMQLLILRSLSQGYL